MQLPTLSELKMSISSFIEREKISWRTLFSPLEMLAIMNRYRFIHFLVIGGTGVVINLGVTWFLTTFFFGLEDYFTAYICGLIANLLFNFVLYSKVVFGTSRDHTRRLIVFMIYSICMASFQAWLVSVLVPLIGLKFYLIVIAGVIGFFSIVNFFIFKLSLFKERLLGSEG